MHTVYFISISVTVNVESHGQLTNAKNFGKIDRQQTTTKQETAMISYPANCSHSSHYFKIFCVAKRLHTICLLCHCSSCGMHKKQPAMLNTDFISLDPVVHTSSNSLNCIVNSKSLISIKCVYSVPYRLIYNTVVWVCLYYIDITRPQTDEFPVNYGECNNSISKIQLMVNCLYLV